MEHYEEAMDEAQRNQKEKLSNHSPVFLINSIPAILPEKMEQNHIRYRMMCLNGIIKNYLSIEKETLGFYITGHPLLRFADRLKFVTNADSSNLNDQNGIKIPSPLPAWSAASAEKTTKRKDIMCYHHPGRFTGFDKHNIFGRYI